MGRPIDADKLWMDIIRRMDYCEDMLEIIKKQPTVEAEQKTGKWNFVGNQMFECTNCEVAYTEYQFEKMRVRYNDPKFPKFCPNCGADMRGDSDDS